MSTDGPGRRSRSRRAGIAPEARGVRADGQRFVVGTAVVEQLSTEALLDEIRRLATTADRPALVVSGNAHGLVLAQRDPIMRTIHSIADLVRTDGASLVLAARLLLGYVADLPRFQQLALTSAAGARRATRGGPAAG